jgi:hypothetical protein
LICAINNSTMLMPSIEMSFVLSSIWCLMQAWFQLKLPLGCCLVIFLRNWMLRKHAFSAGLSPRCLFRLCLHFRFLRVITSRKCSERQHWGTMRRSS